MSNHQPLLPTRQACGLNWAFLLDVCQFQLIPSFSKTMQCVVSTRVLLSHPSTTQVNSAHVLPHTLQAERKCSLHVFGHQFYGAGGKMSPQPC
jgi:hypothetical protein